MSALSPEYVLRHSGEAITDLCFWDYAASPKSNLFLLAACGGSAGTDLWDLGTRRPVCSIPSVGGATTTSVTGIGDGNVLTLDKEGNLTMSAITDAGPKTITSLVISNVAFCKASVLDQRESENKILVGVPGDEKSSFNIWDMKNCKIVSRLILPDHLSFGMPMTAKIIGKDNLYACVGYEDGSIVLWDVLEHKLLSVGERMYTEPVMCMDMPSDVLSGVCGSATNVINKWNFLSNDDNIYSYHNLKSHHVPNAGIASVKIRRDSKIFATGGWDYKVRIFSWKTCKPLAVLDYHKGTVQALAFSQPANDKQLLACGSNDNKISIWDVYNQ